MLRPLSTGTYVVSFGGSLFGGGFSTGATYTLTVQAPN
jgi:hypothetical protein